MEPVCNLNDYALPAAALLFVIVLSVSLWMSKGK
jgi:hypothetical protein